MRSMAYAAAAAGLLAWSNDSSASLRFHNDTNNTISTLDAFASRSGFGCGFEDGCSGDEAFLLPPGFRVRGWFNIARGGTMVVESHAVHNARHETFAQDAFGNVWSGTSRRFCINNNIQNHCGNDCPAGIAVIRQFIAITNTTCCGFWCSPENFTFTFFL